MRRVLVAITLILLVSWGCQKKPAVVSPPVKAAPEAPTPAPAAVTPEYRGPAVLEPAPIPKTITAPSNLELCDKNFEAGNYLQAAKACEAFLGVNPKSENRDRVLFHLGLSRALSSDSGRDLRQTEVVFKRLISEFPGSQYKSQAEFILGLQSQIERLRSDVKEREDKIKKLSEELQVLKEIDLQRRPSRPPEKQSP